MKAKLINNYMKYAKNYVLNTKKKAPTKKYEVGGLKFSHLYIDDLIFRKNDRKASRKKVKKNDSDTIIINEKVIPKADHKHGYTNKLIKSIMTKEEFKKFNKWMGGQTCAMDDVTKEIITYPCDVLRFLEMVRVGKPTYWD